MTFEEARLKMASLPDTYESEGLEFEFLIIPALQIDKDLYQKFVTENYRTIDINDEDSIIYSTNKKFSVGGIWTDGINLVFDDTDH